MLKLQNIDVTIAKGTKSEWHILQDLNLNVSSGEFIVVIGSNGAGKSTMLNVISGLTKPDCGEALIENQNIANLPKSLMCSVIAKVTQDPKRGTMENMTIYENMAFSLKRGASRFLIPFATENRKSLFQEKLRLLDMGLENRIDDIVSNLSGGQRQALSLVMSTLAGAKIFLLDEITAALDPKAADQVIKLTNKIIRDEKATCIMITHNMSHAIEYGDRTLLLKDGNFIKEFSGDNKKHLTPVSLAAEFGEI